MRTRVLVAGAAAMTLLPAGPAVAVGVQHVQARAVRAGSGVKPGGPRPVLPVRPTDAAGLRAAKAAAERRHEVRKRRSLRAEAGKPRAAVFGSLNQPGLTADDGGGATPPDTTGSIGPSHYVEMVNSAVAVYRRADLGGAGSPVSLETFMGSPGGTFVTDPQIQWDEQGQRWLYLAVAITLDSFGNVTGPNYTLFGLSKSTDPSDLTNGWCSYSLPSGTATGHGNLGPDFPKLGHDNLHILFGTDVFDQPGDFVTSQITSLPKPAPGTISSCPASLAATVFGSVSSPLKTSDGDTVSTPVPANTADSSSSGYIVAADNPANAGSARNQLMAWHMAGSATAPALTADGNIGVNSYDVPASALQPNAFSLDTLDGRLTTAVAHSDPNAAGAEAVWTQHTVDPGDGSVGVRWYELVP